MVFYGLYNQKCGQVDVRVYRFQIRFELGMLDRSWVVFVSVGFFFGKQYKFYCFFFIFDLLENGYSDVKCIGGLRKDRNNGFIFLSVKLVEF